MVTRRRWSGTAAQRFDGDFKFRGDRQWRIPLFAKVLNKYKSLKALRELLERMFPGCEQGSMAYTKRKDRFASEKLTDAKVSTQYDS